MVQAFGTGRSYVEPSSGEDLKLHGLMVQASSVNISLSIFFLELVLKVRIQNPSLRENDFIEIELDRQELTYQELLRVSCCELGVNPDQVEKIRKLPNTLVRKVRKVC